MGRPKTTVVVQRVEDDAETNGRRRRTTMRANVAGAEKQTREGRSTYVRGPQGFRVFGAPSLRAWYRGGRKRTWRERDGGVRLVACALRFDTPKRGIAPPSLTTGKTERTGENRRRAGRGLASRYFGRVRVLSRKPFGPLEPKPSSLSQRVARVLLIRVWCGRTNRGGGEQREREMGGERA